MTHGGFTVYCLAYSGHSKFSEHDSYYASKGAVSQACCHADLSMV